MDDSLDLLLNGQVYKKFQEHFCSVVLKKYNLNMVDVRVLLFLYEHKRFDTAKDIVSERYLTKSYVSKSLEKLIDRGFLSTKHMKNDRRYIHLIIEEEALPIIQAVHTQRQKMMRALFQGVTEEQTAVLGDIATKLSRNISAVLRDGCFEQEQGKL
ncbi:MAG: MarR family transcriptional regulator [Clostridiaceae bacterium]|nr:MarR family transcriptional regulator [Clostridiaceae bacterium]